MASQPIPPNEAVANGRPLTQQEWWDLLWSLEGSMEGWFPEEGGPSAILQRERDVWGRVTVYPDSIVMGLLF